MIGKRSKNETFWNPCLLSCEISFLPDTGWFALLQLVWFFLSKQGSCRSCDPWALRTHPTCLQKGLQPETPCRDTQSGGEGGGHFQGRSLLNDWQ